MIVLDASALIAQLDKNYAHHDRIGEYLLEFSTDRLGASVITLAEALVAPARAGRLDEALALLDELEIEPIGVGPDEVRHLAALRAETGLRMPDCCVLLAAWLADAERIGTFDEQLTRAAAARDLETP